MPKPALPLVFCPTSLNWMSQIIFQKHILYIHPIIIWLASDDGMVKKLTQR